MRIPTLAFLLLLFASCVFSQQNTSLITDVVDGQETYHAPPPVISGVVEVVQQLYVPNCCSGVPRTLDYTARLFGEHGNFAVANLTEAPTKFSIDTTQVRDGVYALTYTEQDPTLFPIASIVIVDNVPGPAMVTMAPACGYDVPGGGTAPGSFNPPNCILVPVDPPQPPVYPFPFVAATPYQTIPAHEDLIVEYVVPNWPLYHYQTRWWRSQNGEPYVQALFNEGHRDFDVFKDIVDRRPFADGPRGIGYWTGAITGAVHPVTGELYFVEKGAKWGRLGKMSLDGATTTLAGFRLKANTLPFHPWDGTAPFGSQLEKVGDWSEYPPGRFRLPMDLAFDPNDVNTLYVADVDNQRIARVDLSVDPVKVYPHAEGLDRPTSVQVGNDGVYFIERDLRQLRFIDAQGASSTSVQYGCRPLNARMAGHGNDPPDGREHVYAICPDSGQIMHWNHTVLSATATFEPNTWSWLEVDRACASGPCGVNPEGQKFNQLFVAASYASENFMRFDHQTSTWSNVTHANIRAETRANNAATGHYPWMVAAGADGSLWSGGFGTLGVQRIRLAQPAELPADMTYQETLTHKRGWDLWYAGCGDGCAWGDAVGYSVTHGVAGGNGLLGFINVEDLAALDDAALDTALLEGLGTGAARSFTNSELSDLRFFLRRRSAYATRGLKPSGGPPPPPPPECANEDCCGTNTVWNGMKCAGSCLPPIDFELVKTGGKTAECRVK